MCFLLGAPELSLQPGNMLIAGHVVGCNFSLPLLDIGEEAQGDLSEQSWGHPQLKEVVCRCGGDGRLGSGLAIDQDDRRGIDLKDRGQVRCMLRGANNGAPIQGCGQHLVHVVEQAEGVLVFTEEGVFQAVRLREVGVEEIDLLLFSINEVNVAPPLVRAVPRKVPLLAAIEAG